MLASDIPNWSAKRFAADATGTFVRTVPQTSGDPAAASMSLGFPPQTFTDEGAGGTPPDGRDFNGILNFLSAWTQWQGAGGTVPFNSAIATAGGYPKGARLASSVNPSLVWINQVDSNTTNPDSGGAANWVYEGDLGHSYNQSNGYVTIGKLILNFGGISLPDNSGHTNVNFAKPFTSTVLFPGAANDCGNGYPSATAAVGNVTLTGMNIGMSVAPSVGGGALAPAGAGTAAFWWALGA